MNKNLARIVTVTIEAIIMGLVVKYAGYEVAIISLLVLIYVELLIGGKDNVR